MITSRRDLLKYFGIGATIVPVIGGTPKIEAPAELIAVPEIQPLVTPEQLDLGWKNIHAFETGIFRKAGRCEIEVHIKTDERVWHFKADTFINKTETRTFDVTSFDSPRPWRNIQQAPLSDIRWQMEGICTGSNSLEAWEKR